MQKNTALTPSNPPFTLRMKVRDYECDAQGIVNNANYLHYFEHARHEMLETYGLQLKQLTAKNIFPVVSSAFLQYKHSLHGSDTFLCNTYIVKKGIRYIFIQEIIRDADNKLCCKATIEVATLINGKLAKPTLFDEAFSSYFEKK